MKCPDLATLQLLLSERLNAEEFREVEAHVEECLACQTTLKCLLTEERGLALTTLTEASSNGPPASSGSPETNSMARRISSVLSYRLLSFIAEGGLGNVYKAKDEELDREVALKLMKVHGDADSFLREAQITAKLDHPGVVPVHGLIHDTDGQPCYAMRFIEGETLYQALKRFHDADKEPGRDPSERTLAFRKLLTQFIAVCNTIGFAHSRGILHRDLKPGNIMLGDYGETLVGDWGLAKPFDRTERERATAKETLRPVMADNVEAATRLGDAKGTPAYMSPEQAAGQWDAVDRASDIFSLGATLYVLLTGQAPYQGETQLEIVQKARRGDFLPPRQLRFDVPRALEAICLKAMAFEPEKRYQTAKELAADVEQWLADEPVRAYREPWNQRAARWTRHHKGLMSAAATFVFVTATIGVAWLLVTAARNRLEADQTHRLFQQDMKTAEFLLLAFPTEPEKLQQGLDLGQKAAGRYQVSENPAWQERAAVKLLTEEDQGQLRDSLGELFYLLAQAKLSQARTTPDADQKHRQAGEALAWNAVAQKCYGADQASRALTWQRAELEALLDHPQEATRLRQQYNQLPASTATDQYLLAAGYSSQGRYHEALGLLEKVTRRSPANFWAWFTLGVCHDMFARYEAAAACYSTSIALQSDFPYTYYNRGLAEFRLGKYEEARADFDRALQRQPDMPEALINRALAFQGLGKYSEGIEDLTRALELKAQATQVYWLRGQLRQIMGDREGAQRDLADCLKQKPTDFLSWFARGSARMATDPKGALADIEEALKLNPRSLGGLQNKAHLLGRLGRNQEGIQVLDKAVELYPDYVPSRAGRGVYHARLSHRDLAHQDAEESLRRDKSPKNVYQLAGIYALTSRTHPEDQKEAIRLLSMAFAKDAGLLSLLENDKDLDPIRQSKEFTALVDKTRALVRGATHTFTVKSQLPDAR
jgi:serine/threonine protein kinase/Tfp pilus assembly protein PilF